MIFNGMAKNTKVLVISLVSVAVLAGVGIAAYFMLSGSDKYVNCIPQESDMVFRMNITEAAEGIGFNSEEGKKLISQLEAMSPDTKDSKVFQKLKENPASCGLRIDKPIYFFGNVKKEYGGVAICVNSESDLENTIKEIAEEEKSDIKITKENGLNWVKSQFFGNNAAVAFNSDVLLIAMGNDADEKLEKWTKLSGDECYSSTGRLKKLNSITGQFAMDISYASIIKQSGQQVAMAVSMASPDLNEMLMVAGLSFAKDEIVSEFECYSLDPAIQKKLENCYDAFGKISGEYAEKVPEDYVVWGGANINGSNYAEMLMATPMIKTALEGAKDKMGIDPIKMISDISGDLAFFMSMNVEEMNATEGLPNIAINMKVGNNSFVDDIVNALEKLDIVNSDILTKESKGNYSLYTKSYDWESEQTVKSEKPVFFFGVDGNDCYFSTKKEKQTSGTKAMAEYMDIIKKSYMFFVLNPKAIVKLIDDLSKTGEKGQTTLAEMSFAKEMLSCLKDSYMYSDSPCKVKAVIKGNKDKFLLSYIIDFKEKYDKLMSSIITVYDEIGEDQLIEEPEMELDSAVVE